MSDISIGFFLSPFVVEIKYEYTFLNSGVILFCFFLAKRGVYYNNKVLAASSFIPDHHTLPK
jgi:hypothetical protein